MIYKAVVRDTEEYVYRINAKTKEDALRKLQDFLSCQEEDFSGQEESYIRIKDEIISFEEILDVN